MGDSSDTSTEGATLSDNKQTVMKYVDGFSKTDHAQILSCLTDDIWWTVFGGHQVHGKHEYDARASRAVPSTSATPISRSFRSVVPMAE